MELGAARIMHNVRLEKSDVWFALGVETVAELGGPGPSTLAQRREVDGHVTLFNCRVPPSACIPTKSELQTAVELGDEVVGKMKAERST